MAYSFQTFSVGQVLTAAHMNQVEYNIRDHVHGASGVAELTAYSRLADNETITGAWIFQDQLKITAANPYITLSSNLTDVPINTVFGILNFYSNDSSTNSIGGVGSIRVNAETAFNTGNTPTYMTFHTHDNTGNDGTLLGDTTERVRITSTGNVGIGVTPETKLHILYGGDSGGTSHAQASVTVESNTTHYINLLSPNTHNVGFMFGDPEASAQGMIYFSHSNNSLSFRIDGSNDYVVINSSNQLVLSRPNGTAPLVITSSTVIPNLNTEQHNGLKVKVVDIGDWNMDSTISVSVYHGLTLTKIRNLAVLVRNDADNQYFPINQTPGTGIDAWISGVTGTDVVLQRLTSGYFDSTSYDSTSYNRGWITIWYTP